MNFHDFTSFVGLNIAHHLGQRFRVQDIVQAFQIKNPRYVLSRMLDCAYFEVTNPSRRAQDAEVAASGLYRLIFCGSNDEAAAFRAWVLHDVLHPILTTGICMLSENEWTSPEGFLSPLTAALEQSLSGSSAADVEFQNWVCLEVLPAIFDTGTYEWAEHPENIAA